MLVETNRAMRLHVWFGSPCTRSVHRDHSLSRRNEKLTGSYSDNVNKKQTNPLLLLNNWVLAHFFFSYVVINFLSGNN
jgi:hypothetical protein